MTEGSTIVAGSKSEAEALTVEDFEFVRKLGKVTVPKDWSSRTTNSELRILCSRVLGEWDERFDDEKYPSQTHKFRPGQRFDVALYKPRNPASEYLHGMGLEFITRNRGLCLGIPGAALIMSQLQSMLNLDEMLTFIDSPDRLIEVKIKDRGMVRHMPCMAVGRGKFDLNLCPVDDGWAPTQSLVFFTPFLR